MNELRRSSSGWARQSLHAFALAGLAISLGCGSDRDASNGTSADAAGQQHAGDGIQLLDAPLPPNATLEQALAHRDPLVRAQRVAEILQHSAPDQLDGILDAIESSPLAWGDIEYTLFASWWARFDPSAAMAYCEKELRLRHPRTVGEVLRTWGRIDPAAAISSGWLVARTLDGANFNAEYLDPIVVGWFESGRPGLESWIEALDPSSKASALQAYMRMRILRDGSQPALEWAIAAPYSADLQRLLLGTGLHIVARREPGVAVEWLDKATEKGVDVRTFVPRIARGWANTSPNPGEVIEWVMTREIESPMERVRSVSDITRIWLRRDKKAVADWLDTRTETWSDYLRTLWIQDHVASAGGQVDYLDLMNRAGRFVDAEDRKAQYLWNTQQWMGVDPDAAKKWLAENEALLGDKIGMVGQQPAENAGLETALDAAPDATKQQ